MIDPREPVNSIIQINEKQFELYLHDIDYDYFLYANPIPLTEGWLLKLGFEWWGSGWYKLKSLFISIEKKRASLNGDAEEVEIKFQKYVHQLQNLFYSLTGKELEVKQLTTS